VTHPEAVPASRSRSRHGTDVAILLVDDEPPFLRALSASLTAEGYAVKTADTAQGALDAVNEEEPDVIVLDLGLPDLDGIEVCRRLRRWSVTPVIVLTADGADDRKVRALDEGADDYLTKPFSLPELLARVRVVLRHRSALAAVLDPAGIEVGDLVIDTDGHVVTVGGLPLELTRKEFALLALLARNAGRVLTYRRVLLIVWGVDGDGSTQALRTLVAGVRKKLGEGPRRPRIENASGIGYRMITPE
jgi:two-component system, OmpR family, KDP operon response regulator KdpE